MSMLRERRLELAGFSTRALDRFLATAVAHAGERGGGAHVVVAGNSLGGLAAMRAAENEEPAIAGIVPVAPAGLEMARWFPIVGSATLVRMIARSPAPAGGGRA